MKKDVYNETKVKIAKEAKRRRKRAWVMRQAGMTLQEIGDTFGVTRQAADYMVRKHEREENK